MTRPVECPSPCPLFRSRLGTKNDRGATTRTRARSRFACVSCFGINLSALCVRNEVCDRDVMPDREALHHALCARPRRVWFRSAAGLRP